MTIHRESSTIVVRRAILPILGQRKSPEKLIGMAGPRVVALNIRPWASDEQERESGLHGSYDAALGLGTGSNATATGRSVVRLDNTQSWELDQPDPLLAVGDKVTIRRATLGSFLLTTPTNRVHRVRRIN